jgi:transcriptional regulator with XRE-family HTH domain
MAGLNGHRLSAAEETDEAMKRLTLREARARRGLTQEQLEAASGVSQAVISAIERGVVNDPNSSTVMKLAAALNMDPRVLKFGHSDEAVAS